ncbi:helix-turn-helix domain-containing protein [Wukongibacter sp. M2B1]|uniref:helix-turn-helix domain-containing protein n=1 Tax=Wukongibacter sp. M2B1 TaxID=3088895 RepID=UPI003D7A6626
MHFGNRLRKSREKKELTQAKLAEKFSVSEATISFFERNKKPPTYELLNKITTYFNVTEDYLLGHDEVDLKTFGNRLRELRKEKRLNQTEIGGILNIVPSNISHYEAGKARPSLQTIYILANYFDVSIDYLVGRTDRKDLFTIQDQDIQEVGEQYLEFHKELEKMGLTPQIALSKMKKFYRAGECNKICALVKNKSLFW